MITVDLPRINSLVELVLEDDSPHASRVEDLDGQMLSVAAPVGVGRVEPGASVTVRWVGERGVYSAPATLAGTVRDRIALWTLRTVGMVEFGTRRSAVRVPVNLPVRVLDPETDRCWNGRMADLSEGGFRFHLVDRPPPSALRVRADFDLDGEQIRVEGQVLRTITGRGDQESEAVVVYSSEESVARLIRRYVMHRQILARRVKEDETG